MKTTIKNISAREILDSRGNPTIEVDVITEKGLSRAAVPSGASTGCYEAVELRDNDKNRFFGKGVSRAVRNVNEIIAPKLTGMDCTEQKKIDELMIELDATENKANLGANAILGVSMAVCKNAASCLQMPLYKYIGEISDTKSIIIPIPQMNVINSGKHAGIKNDIQEHMIMPIYAESFSHALRMSTEVYQNLKNLLKNKFGAAAIHLGDEGGFAPPIKDINDRLELITKSIEDLGYEKNFGLAIDSASSEFYNNGKYKIIDNEYSSGELIDFYADLTKTFNLISIEDGMAEDDWDGWVELMKKIGNKIQIIGDDLLVTNTNRIKKAIKLNAVNCVLLKPNQIGTITETIDAYKLASKNKLRSVVSQRSGCTEDIFDADLVVGLSAGQFKYGAPARVDRTAKYNQLLRIEENEKDNCVYYSL
ncbi:MAG: phosphopyruvate hydratase [Candidatus Aenigmarchaeota archaeon ex4484_52]|nr:MAG: phosphopyruvate hydratase [Candidatus Aenigmarchaeota archaeon ex4484_52]